MPHSDLRQPRRLEQQRADQCVKAQKAHLQYPQNKGVVPVGEPIRGDDGAGIHQRGTQGDALADADAEGNIILTEGTLAACV